MVLITHAPVVPRNPQPIEAMRARLPAALERDWPLKIPEGQPWPATSHQCVFDWQDGLRLVITLQESPFDPGCLARLHVSASLWPDSDLARSLLPWPPFAAFVLLIQRIEQAATELFRPAHFNLRLRHVSDHRIAHFEGPTRAELATMRPDLKLDEGLKP